MLASSITFFGASLLFSTLLLNIDGWRPFKLIAKNVTWKVYNDLEAININASIIKSGAISIWVDVLENINHPFIHTEIYIDSGNGKFDFELLNRTVDICEMFHDQGYEPLLQIFYRILQENGSWPNKCPIQKSQFSIENLIVDPEKLPPYLPERKGFATLRFKQEKNGILEDVADLTVVFALENTSINRLKNAAKRNNRLQKQFVRDVLYNERIYRMYGRS